MKEATKAVCFSLSCNRFLEHGKTSLVKACGRCHKDSDKQTDTQVELGGLRTVGHGFTLNGEVVHNMDVIKLDQEAWHSGPIWMTF